MSLNRVFLGSPGTGETTVAKLYGHILTELELLSNGEVVAKNPSDFVGAYLGHSEKNTKAILDSIVGKVLVIDEECDPRYGCSNDINLVFHAYMLYSNDINLVFHAYMLYSGKSSGSQDQFKMTVIDTMVVEIQSVPGEDCCVLILGYKEQMEDMLQVHSGIKSVDET
ncbi:hypothetical protein M405DRAFT_865786 [Rhizopogon salebrosus TDB-379]|nr:hypothetical protein M405DRAFT_865786 [Rhizopogon salebrosus TDB-379]